MSILPANIRAVSLDFANTLYPLRIGELETTIERLHAFLQDRLGCKIEYAAFRQTYLDFRDRQFAQNRPTLRENDFTLRIAHVVSMALGGAPAPADIVAAAANAYAFGFIDTMTPPAGLRRIMEALSIRFNGNVAVCSNFMRADAIRVPLERDGISEHLAGIVVSCEIGFIKPHRLVFDAVARVLQASPCEIVHVGDDWEADMIGATRCGMSAIYTHQWRDEPDSAYGVDATPLAEIDTLERLLTI